MHFWCSEPLAILNSGALGFWNFGLSRRYLDWNIFIFHTKCAESPPPILNSKWCPCTNYISSKRRRRLITLSQNLLGMWARSRAVQATSKRSFLSLDEIYPSMVNMDGRQNMGQEDLLSTRQMPWTDAQPVSRVGNETLSCASWKFVYGLASSFKIMAIVTWLRL